MAWKKGESGNPAGGYRNKPFTQALIMALKEDPRALRNIATMLRNKAAKGDKHAIDTIADRLDGKAVQGLALTDGEGGPLKVQIIQFSQRKQT